MRAGRSTKEQIRNKLWTRLTDQVGDRIESEVRYHTEAHVQIPIWSQIGRPVGNIIVSSKK